MGGTSGRWQEGLLGSVMVGFLAWALFTQMWSFVKVSLHAHDLGIF